MYISYILFERYYIQQVKYLKMHFDSTQEKICQQAFIRILRTSSFKQTQSLVQDPQIIKIFLRELMSSQECLGSFKKCLMEQALLNNQQVEEIINKLCQCRQSYEILKLKWLKTQISKKIFDYFALPQAGKKTERQAILMKISTYLTGTKTIQDLVGDIFKGLNQADERQAQELCSYLLQNSKISDFDIQRTVENFKFSEVKIKEHQNQIEKDIQFYSKAKNSIQYVLETEIYKAFKNLVNQKPLQEIDISYIQKLICQKNLLSQQIEKQLKELKNLKEKQLFSGLLSLKLKLCRLNILQIQRLVLKTKNAKAGIKGKDAIVLIGDTGAGKTTTILKLLGYQLRPIILNKLPTLVPTQRLDPLHQALETSPATKSTTKAVFAAKIPEDMYHKNVNSDNRTFWILDTPGAGDTQGADTDISNGLGILDALLSCSSVRIVLLIDEASMLFKKGEGILILGRLITQMFINFQKVYHNIQILFNKVNQIQTIQGLLQDKLQKYKQSLSKDGNLILFLELALQKSKNKENYLYPLATNYKNVLEQIRKMKPIQNIQTNMRFTFTSATNSEITNYIQKTQNNIKKLFQNNNYEESSLHLTLLKKLKSIIYTSRQLQDRFLESFNYVKNALQSRIKMFNDGLQQTLSQAVSSSEMQRICKIGKEIQQIKQNFDDLNLNNEDIVQKILLEYQRKITQTIKNPQKIAQTEVIIQNSKQFFEFFDPAIKKTILSAVIQSYLNYLQQTKRICFKQEFDVKIMQQLKSKVSLYKFFKNGVSKIQINFDQTQQIQFLIELTKRNTQMISSLQQDVLQNTSAIMTKDFNYYAREFKKLQYYEKIGLLRDQYSMSQLLKNLIQKRHSKIEELLKIIQSFKIVQGQNETEQTQLLANTKTILDRILAVFQIQQQYTLRYNLAKSQMMKNLNKQLRKIAQILDKLRMSSYDDLVKDVETAASSLSYIYQIASFFGDKNLISDKKALFSNQFQRYLKREQNQIQSERQINLRHLNADLLKKMTLTLHRIEKYEKQILNIIPNLENRCQAIKILVCNKIIGPLNNKKQSLKNICLENMHHHLDKLEVICGYILKLEDQFGIIFDKNEVLKSSEFWLFFKKRMDQIAIDIQQKLVNNEFCISEYSDLNLGPFDGISQNNSNQSLSKDEKIQQASFQTMSKSFISLDSLLRLLVTIRDKKKNLNQFLEDKYNLDIQKQLNLYVQMLQTRKIQIYRELENRENCQDQKFVAKYLKECQNLQKRAAILNCQNKPESDFKQFLDKFKSKIRHNKEENQNKCDQLCKHSLQTLDLQLFCEIYKDLLQAPDLNKKLIQKMKRFIKKQQQQLCENLKRKSNYLQDKDFSSFTDLNAYLTSLDTFLIKTEQIRIFQPHHKQLIEIKYQQGQSQLKLLKQFLQNRYLSLQKIIDIIFTIRPSDYQQQISQFKQIQTVVYQFRGISINKKTKLHEFCRKIMENLYISLAKRYSIEQNQEKSMLKSSKIQKTKISSLLESIIKNKIEKLSEIYLKSQNFEIDNSLKQYSQYLQRQKLTKQQQKLFKNIKEIMSEKINNLSLNFNAEYQICRQKEQEIFSFLQKLRKIQFPLYVQLQDQYKNFIQDQGKSIRTLIDEKIQQISSNPKKLHEYLEEISRAKSNKQQGLLKKYSDSLMSLYQEKSSYQKTLQQTINHLKDWFQQIILDENLLNQHQIMPKFTKFFNLNIEKLVNFLYSKLRIINLYFQQNLLRIKLKEDQIDQIMTQAVNCLQYIFWIKVKYQNYFAQNENILKQIRQRLLNIQTKVCKNIQNLQNILSIFEIKDDVRYKSLLQSLIYYKDLNFMYERWEKRLEKIALEKNTSNQRVFLHQYPLNKNFISNRCHQKIKNLKIQIIQTCQKVRSFEFFDYFKKTQDSVQLQKQFEHLKEQIQLLKVSKDIFDNFLNENQRTYQISELLHNLKQKFQSLFSQVKRQIKNVFENINYENEDKISLYYRIIEIFKRKRYMFIENINSVLQKNDQFVNDIEEKFEILKHECQQALQKFRSSLSNQENQILNNQTVFKNCMIKLKGQLQAIQIQKSKSITQNFQQKCSQQQDESKKQILKKAYDSDIQSLKTQSTLCFQRQKSQMIQQFSKTKEALQQQSADYCLQFLQKIILYFKATSEIIYHNKYQQQRIQNVFNNLDSPGKKTFKITTMIIDTIQTKLTGNSQIFGQRLLLNHKIFQSYQQKQFKKQTQSQDINYVIKNIKKRQERYADANNKELNFFEFSEKEKETTQSQYSYYFEEYQSSKKQFLKQKVPQGEQLGFLVRNIKSKADQCKSSQTVKEHCQLIARITAFWECYKAQKNDKNEYQFAIELHPTQITTLLVLIFGVTNTFKIDNRFAQVGTGQGKSVVLAFLSAYLALIGYEVYCACYSAYLSQRDRKCFSKLFELLDLQNRIIYGTFNELCKDILNVKDGTDQQSTIQNRILKQIIQPKNQNYCIQGLLSSNKATNKDKKILMIDELDVFFQDNFFGMTYNPSVNLCSRAIQSLIKYIWQVSKQQKQRLKPNFILQSFQFKNILQQFPNLQELLNNQIYGMIDGALNFKHDYHIDDKKIVYRDNDAFSDKISYGYKTVFAYLYEYQQGKVSYENTQKALKITLRVAQFSYAQLPNYYDNILGVTGTLEVIPQFKKNLLRQRYNIVDQFLIPSAFGQNKRRKENYHIVAQSQYYEKIIDCMNKVDPIRPIIIFFNSIQELNDFFQSETYKKYGNKNAVSLNQLHSDHTKLQRISNATFKSMRTLMTDSFGRGIDFIVLNKDINLKGGVHIIQAFLSLEQSQEVQIKGRTTRQNNQGSYDAVICQQFLEKLNISCQQLKRCDDIHKYLKQKRSQKAEAEFKSIQGLLKQSDQLHQKTIKALNFQENNSLLQYIFELNRFPVQTNIHVRAILAIDATGSMSNVLKQACNICNQAFQRTYEILHQKHTLGTFEVKVIVYRNYNATYDTILQSTAFESTPNALRQFLSQVKANYGWGDEALQVLLQSINKQQFLDQVILIGDAKAQNEKDITIKRQGTKLSRGEEYWNSHDFPKTTFKQELRIFKEKECPIHSFYIQERQFFQELSRQTGGYSAKFNVRDQSAPEHLTQFIVQQILQAIGNKGSGNGFDLVEAYRDKYIKMYMDS